MVPISVRDVDGAYTRSRNILFSTSILLSVAPVLQSPSTHLHAAMYAMSILGVLKRSYYFVY